MTDSDAPTTHPSSYAVGLTSSYAQRVDGQVRLVLHLEGPVDLQPSPEPPSLRLTAGSRIIEAAVAVQERDGQPVLECRLDNNRLRGATWRLELVDQRGSSRVEARLVVRARQPVALLPGPEPTTVLEPPTPRVSQPAGPTPHGRVRSAVAGPVKAALSRLPSDRAERYRKILRDLAARLNV